MLDLGDSDDYYKSTFSSSNYRDKIKNVKFVDYIAPEEELNSVASNANWDLSSIKDKSIMGWLKEENEDETAPYTLYIGSKLKEGEKIIVRSFAYAFYNMSNLETVDLNLEILDTGNLNNTSYMFYYNSKLTEITGIEDLDTHNVTNMSWMFYYASSLTSLDLSNWDTQNVTNMSKMFYYASSSIIPDISNWDTSKVENMGGLFGYTSYNYDVSKIDTHNVTDMSYMFYSYKGAEITGIKDLNVSNVTDMSSMFYNTNLIELDLSSWNVSNVINMASMFGENYKQLVNININNWNTHNVTNMSKMFGMNTGGINSYFKITGIESLDVSNVKDMSSMFRSASGLTSLDLINWDTHNVTTMSNMFAGYENKEIIGIENLDVSNVTNMSSMFCESNLTSLDLSKWDTHSVTSMFRMFYYAGSLTNIDMRKATFSQVTSFGSMFKSTNSALQVTISGEENKNWFIDNGVLTEDHLEVLPE